ncbi:hypothetical protein ABKV19_003836 [Rosa sericea]
MAHKSTQRRKRKSMKAKALIHRIIPEEYFEKDQKKNRVLLDPRGQAISRWSKIFLCACLVSLFVDPLFLYLPIARDEVCIDIDINLQITLTIVRSVADIFHLIHIFVKFHTAYVAPSSSSSSSSSKSRVFGERSDLVTDPLKIAVRYICKDFCIDLLAFLPLPQMVILGIIPYLRGSTEKATKTVIWFIIIFQYIPRVFRIFPLRSQIIDVAGVLTSSAWAGAAYNLTLYMLASHVAGACWYLLAIGRHKACLKNVCLQEKVYCQKEFFDCHRVHEPARVRWFKWSNVTTLCNPYGSNFYQYGIYGNAVTSGIIGSTFFEKYFYCFWWGLQQLSSLGQSLSTSRNIGEILFTIVIATLGLVLFGLLIGNMQRYLQSTITRREEWRVKQSDTEQWMHHRQLPPEIRQSIKEYEQYKWIAMRGVDEETLLQSFPVDLRRAVKRHICLSLVQQVPLFNQMDDTTLDAICERLKPALWTKTTFLVREGDPVIQMHFISRGQLDSSVMKNSHQIGTATKVTCSNLNSRRIGAGDFCGEELLTWALNQRPKVVLPSSARTVKAISEVEAFTLSAEDLKFVVSKFRRHAFRFHSQQTWAACVIQAAWHRYKRMKQATEVQDSHQSLIPPPVVFWKKYGEKLVQCARNNRFTMHKGLNSRV